MKAKTRRATRADLDRMSEIEEEAFTAPWSKGDLVRAGFRGPGVAYVGWLIFEHAPADHQDNACQACGFVLGSVSEGLTMVSDIAVVAAYRRMGLGRALLERVVRRSGRHTRALAAEWNTPYQDFLRACGFRLNRVLRPQEWGGSPGHDSQFVFVHDKERCRG